MENEQQNSGSLVVSIAQLEERFEEFVDRASEGNEIVITKEDTPIAKLVPLR